MLLVSKWYWYRDLNQRLGVTILLNLLSLLVSPFIIYKQSAQTQRNLDSPFPRCRQQTMVWNILVLLMYLVFIVPFLMVPTNCVGCSVSWMSSWPYVLMVLLVWCMLLMMTGCKWQIGKIFSCWLIMPFTNYCLHFFFEGGGIEFCLLFYSCGYLTWT